MTSTAKIDDDEIPLHCWDAYQHVIVQGRGHKEIVERYGVSRVTSWKWCNKVARYLLEHVREEIGQLKVNFLKRLEYVYGEAVAAHEKLKSDEVTTVEESGSLKPEGEGAQPTGQPADELILKKRKVSKRTRHGDPAFLSVALQSVQAMVKLYQHEMDAEDSTSGVRVAGKNASEVLLQQIQILKAKREKLLARGTVPTAPGGGEGDRA